MCGDDVAVVEIYAGKSERFQMFEEYFVRRKINLLSLEYKDAISARTD
jgi:hypothetical protein